MDSPENKDINLTEGSPAAGSRKLSTSMIAGLGLMTALVIVLQMLGSFIRFGPFSISLVLIPIVVGAVLFGPIAGAWLGLVFGLVVLLSGDAAAFLAISVPGTIVTVLLKGILCGLVPGLVYKALSGSHRVIGTFAAAILAPVVNTGIFLLGCLIFFMPTISGWAAEAGLGENVGLFMITGLVGLNFIFELVVNIVLSPTVLRLVRFARKNMSRR